MVSLISWLNAATFITRHFFLLILSSSVYLEQVNAACGFAGRFYIKYSRTRLKRHRFMRFSVYNVVYSVAPISSSLLTTILHFFWR